MSENANAAVKAAKAAYYKQWRETHREEVREYNRIWRKNNADKVKAYNRAYWSKKAGMGENAEV